MTREELLKQGQVRLCRGNAPVILDDPNSCYWVSGGEVEIFLLQEDGERSPWLTLKEGAWLLGQETAAGAPRLAAYATSAEGSQVACLPARLLESTAAFWLPSLPDLLEQYGHLSDAPAPKEARPLRVGGRDTLVYERDHCNSQQGMMWVRPKEGEFRLLSDQGPILPDGWFPLTRSIWVYAERRFMVQTRTTQDVEALGQWLEGVRLLQATCYQSALHACGLRRQALVDAVAQRQRSNSAALSGALRNVAQSLPGSLLAEEESAGQEHSLPILAKNLEEAFGCPFPPGLDPGLPLPQALARAARCRWRAVLLREGWWKYDGGPILVQRDGYFHVARREGNRYQFKPSSPGAGQPITAQLAQELGPQGFVFYQPFPREHLGLTSLAMLCLRLGYREFIVLLLMALLSALLALLTPMATGLLIGTVLPSALEGELVQLILALLVASLGSNMFGLVKSLTQLRMEGWLDSHLQAALFDRLLELPAPFYRQYSLGDLANRAMGFNAIRQALSGAALSSFLGIIFSFFSLAMLFYYNWHLAIVACILAVLQCLLLISGSLMQLKFQRQQLKLAGDLSGRVAQFLGGIAKLRVAGAESRAFFQWSELFEKYRRSVYRLRITNLGMSSLQGLVSQLSQAVIIGFTAHYGYTKALTAASLMSFFSAFGQFNTGLSTLTSSLTSLLSVGPTLERARPILETVPEVEANMPVAAPLKGRVEVKGAWFRFSEQGNWVLEDISIEARPGEFIALVGPSGAGKSSLLRLLLGFETPQRGSVLYDGQNLSQVDPVSLRRQLGVVLQDARLMPGDLFTNIVGSAMLSEDQAWEALRLAGLEDEIRQLPMQLHTVVTDGGGGLSGGQRQRLMIARAVVAKPRVLIFDEATSALDAQTQEKVSESLVNLQATRIVVAHRLSTIRKADRIYVLNNHRVIQSGSFDELNGQAGFFREFASRQMA